MEQSTSLLHRLDELNAIGVALSSERDINRLLEIILIAAKRITNSDAGTLYLVDATQQVLNFEIVHNDTLGIALGGTTGKAITFSPIQLHDATGQPNHHMVVAYAALNGKTINIPDAYAAEGYDFSGTRAFDHKTGYHSTSFLTVPMMNHENETIGVLQLINAKGQKNSAFHEPEIHWTEITHPQISQPVNVSSKGMQDKAEQGVVPFSLADQHLVESLASQAAIALTNRRLIQQMEELFESFIGMINTAIDDKSAYTGGHCERVPILTMLLAEAASRTKTGPLKDFFMTDKDRYELKIAGLLHDCGKVTTPVHVVDKATKLHTLFDRINLIDERFEILKRDAEIAMLREMMQARALPAEQIKQVQANFQEAFELRCQHLDQDRIFLRHCNRGSEKMTEADQERVRQIAQYRWRNPAGEEINFLTADEIENLTIRAGTLTAAERKIINHHIEVTITMLESLPWPKHLKNAPEYAGGHHERMDGTGYPRGLTRDQMSVQARAMGIADIFEALTAKDRPYKEGKTLTESLHILGKFKLNGHIDPDLFDIFVREKIYLTYARQFLDPDQVGEVDESKIPGYVP